MSEAFAVTARLVSRAALPSDLDQRHLDRSPRSNWIRKDLCPDPEGMDAETGWLQAPCDPVFLGKKAGDPGNWHEHAQLKLKACIPFELSKKIEC